MKEDELKAQQEMIEKRLTFIEEQEKAAALTATGELQKILMPNLQEVFKQEYEKLTGTQNYKSSFGLPYWSNQLVDENWRGAELTEVKYCPTQESAIDGVFPFDLLGPFIRPPVKVLYNAWEMSLTEAHERAKILMRALNVRRVG